MSFDFILSDEGLKRMGQIFIQRQCICANQKKSSERKDFKHICNPSSPVMLKIAGGKAAGLILLLPVHCFIYSPSRMKNIVPTDGGSFLFPPPSFEEVDLSGAYLTKCILHSFVTCKI